METEIEEAEEMKGEEEAENMDEGQMKKWGKMICIIM